MITIKLYLDEDITAASHLAATLRQRGFEVVSTIEAGNRKLENSRAVYLLRMLWSYGILAA